jgi:hypothetical protein
VVLAMLKLEKRKIKSIKNLYEILEYIQGMSVRSSQDVEKVFNIAFNIKLTTSMMDVAIEEAIL